mmetsp:Transcript_1742/g.4201  ORF Transcript_1742/g.4201 Transcript_1742/m.4201 type:complete len:504 (+) Transcript_1742:2-1513(+)
MVFESNFWNFDYFEIYDEYSYEDSFAYFWDATFDQKSDMNILAYIGEDYYAYDFENKTEEEIIQNLTGILDLAFDGKASMTPLLKYLVVDWQAEPYIRGGWTDFFTVFQATQIPLVLTTPLLVNDSVGFAGDFVVPDGLAGGVDSATSSGQSAACALLGGALVAGSPCVFTATVRPSIAPSVSPTVSKPPSATPTISRQPSTTPTSKPSNQPSISQSPTASVLPSITINPTQAPTRRGSVVGGICFSGINRVRVDDARHTVRLQDLSIGDRVLTQDNTFEPVYGFGHYQKNQTTPFLQIYTENRDRPLEISEDHMVFVNGQAVPALYLRKGYELDIMDETVVVKDVRQVTRKGAFAPFTPSGTIVVEDVMASCFVAFEESHALTLAGVDFSYQWLAHVFETPHRVFCAVAPQQCQHERYNPDNGISSWVESPLRFGEWTLRQDPWMTNMVLLPIVGVMSTLWFIEQGLLHHQMQSVMWLMAMICCVWWSRRNYAVRRTKVKQA